ncbi:MAG: TolC family protein [Kiritimatiellia bacterium]
MHHPGKFAVLALALLAVSGCLTVFNAQEAQRSVRDKASGAGGPTAGERLDLSGCSLRELVDFALTNRPSMASAALAVADAHLALREIAADAPLVSATPWNAPNLSASGGYSASSVAGHALRARTEGNASAGLSLSVLVYDFGRNRAQASAQAERVLAAEHSFVSAGYEVFEEVSDAYFALLTADALLEVALTNETECALRLQQAQDRFDTGEAKRLDVTSAKLELSQAREETIVASNNVLTAGATMMKALGVDVSQGTREEVFPPFGNALAVVLRGFSSTGYGVREAFDLARTNAPAMAISRARLRAASHQVDLAIAELMPSVSVQAGLSWTDPLWLWNWSASAVQSVFEGFRKTTAVDRAVVQMYSAAADVDEAEQQLSLQLETAIAVRDDSAKALETARASVANALENLNTVKAQYGEGDSSRVDYTIALAKYAQALGDRVSAFYAGQRAETKLFALTGRLPEYREEEIRER